MTGTLIVWETRWLASAATSHDHKHVPSSEERALYYRQAPVSLTILGANLRRVDCCNLNFKLPSIFPIIPLQTPPHILANMPRGPPRKHPITTSSQKPPHIPALLTRVRGCPRKHLFPLLRSPLALRQHAKPRGRTRKYFFRLLNLPPELRQHVYRACVDICTPEPLMVEMRTALTDEIVASDSYQTLHRLS